MKKKQKSIYKSLITNLNLIFVFSLIIFLVFFLFFELNANIKITSRHLYDLNYNKYIAIERYIKQVKDKYDYINSILLDETYEDVLYLDKYKKDKINIFIEKDKIINEVIVIENNYEIIYSSNDYQEFLINNEFFTDLNINNKLIYNNLFVNGEKSLYLARNINGSHILYELNKKDLFNLLDNNNSYHFILYSINGRIIFSKNHEDININEDFLINYGYKHLDNKYLYFEKIDIFGQDYILLNYITHKRIVLETIINSYLSLLFSILILISVYIIIRRRLIKINYLPLKNFTEELELLSEKDLSYVSSIKVDTTYVEINKLLLRIKEICEYNKRMNENKICQAVNKLMLAEESSKSKSLFLANMSHEMRTPLNSIIGYIQLIKRIGFNDSIKLQNYFESINVSSKLLLQKINDILDLSKIESNQFELDPKPSQLKTIVQEMYNLLFVQAEANNIAFNYSIDPQIPEHLEIDGIRLKQVLINLCSNAIKFTKQGKVSLKIDLFGNANDSVIIEYTVKDTGCGIPEENIDNIFIPFKQATNSDYKNTGTGLGLTIARDLIRIMGGDIRVISKENVGTIFTFTTIFKISNNFEKSTNKILNIEELIKIIHSKKILVVEDNQINQILMIEIFKLINKDDIIFANDGNEAVLKCRNEIFDIIFMDIQMPVMNGVEATNIIRTIDGYQNIPIIALSANALTEQVNQYLKAGMTDFLAKPIDIKLLKEIILKYL